MVVAVVADVLTAAVTVKAVVVQLVAMPEKLAVAVRAVVAQAIAQQQVNAPATTAVIKANHVIHLVSQVSVQVASRIKASVLVQAAVTALAYHVVSVRQPVAVVQVAAKVVQLVVLTAVVKVVQTAATVVTTRNYS